ncbi:hypothetical protein COO60DRAFT_1561452, partial [Scenedesmus sp. NREL 46B-D3]
SAGALPQDAAFSGGDPQRTVRARADAHFCKLCFQLLPKAGPRLAHMAYCCCPSACILSAYSASGDLLAAGPTLPGACACTGSSGSLPAACRKLPAAANTAVAALQGCCCCCCLVSRCLAAVAVAPAGLTHALQQNGGRRLEFTTMTRCSSALKRRLRSPRLRLQTHRHLGSFSSVPGGDKPCPCLAQRIYMTHCFVSA